MESSVSSLSPAMTAAAALIVEPVLPDALALVEAASSLGFHVTVADTFQEALERLRVPPALLIADIRLGEYNGLHLVLRGKAARRDLAAIVTSAVADSVLQNEAEQLGATFVMKPTSGQELRAAICRTLLRTSAGPVRPPFERRQIERRMLARPFSHPERRKAVRRRDVLLVIQQSTPM
jgi:two-component system response regulator RegA